MISVSELETWVLGQRELELYVAKFVGARSLAIAGAVFKLRLGALKRAAAHATEEISSVKQDDIRCVMERTKLRLKKKETKVIMRALLKFTTSLRCDDCFSVFCCIALTFCLYLIILYPLLVSSIYCAKRFCDNI